MNSNIDHNHTTQRPLKSMGQTGIPIITAIGAILALFLPWNAWLSVRSVAEGETLSATLQWQADTTRKIDFLIEKAGAVPEQVAQSNRYDPILLSTTTQSNVQP